MQQEFADLPCTAAPDPLEGSGTPRVLRAHRTQTEWVMVDLESNLPEDHPARAVWAFVESMDLSPWYDAIRAVEGQQGRNAIDPQILMALWLYATLDGVGSARRVDELCRHHVVYQWLCGGVRVNYHTLADFRTAHIQALDHLLTESVAALLHEGLVTLKTIAQDGKRVRASAGASSFRRMPSLQRCLEEAKGHIQALNAEHEGDPACASRREKKARERAAREREARVAQAISRAKELQDKARKNGKDPTHVRVSTTDPETPVMKRGDNGFRPAANVQYATDTQSQIIVGVDVTDETDATQLLPMYEQLQARYGQTPERYLVDASYAGRVPVTTLTKKQTQVYAPLRKPKRPEAYSAHERRAEDTDEYAAFRDRMSTPEAQALYPLRAATAECINAHVTNRGFDAVTVRSLIKIKAIALWHALAHNLTRAHTLRRQLAEVTI